MPILDLDIPESNIEDTPSFGKGEARNFILGMGKVDNDVKILLDIDKVLSAEELILPESQTSVEISGKKAQK